MNRLAFAKESLDVLFDEGLAILEKENLVDLVIQLVKHIERQRILGDFDHRVGALAAGEVFLQVVEGDASGDDTAALVGAFEIFVVTTLFARFGESGLFVDQVTVQALGVHRQQDEALRIAGAGQGVLRQHGLALDAGAAVGQTGRDAIEDGGSEFFRELIAEEDHIVGLLLVGRLEHGYHSPVAIVAAVLLVLRREHRRVISDNDDNALGSDDSSIHKGVATDVETHVLHAGHGAFAGVGNTNRGFESRLFVGAPVGDNTLFLSLF